MEDNRKLDSERVNRALLRLMERGYVEMIIREGEDEPRYRLTKAGIAFAEEREKQK